jgi:hypothetical protein
MVQLISIGFTIYALVILFKLPPPKGKYSRVFIVLFTSVGGYTVGSFIGRLVDSVFKYLIY